MELKIKSTIQSLLFVLDNHRFLKRDYPEIIDIIENYLDYEKIIIESAWKDGYLIGKNGFTIENYSNGKEYFEEVYKVTNEDTIKEQL